MTHESYAKNTVGLFVGSAEDSYENALLRGVFDEVLGAGLNLICFTSGGIRSYHGFEAQSNVLYELVDTENVDGLIISGTLGHSIRADEMKQFCARYQPLPMVSVAADIPGVPGLLVDSYQGMCEVITHLIKEHGYKRLAFIRGPLSQPEAEERYRAYQETLAAHHLEYNPRWVVDGDYTHDSGCRATSELLERGVEVDAIVSCNDSMAMGAIEVLRAQGQPTPGGIAIVGFDDSERGRFFSPSLTTVRQVAYDQGRLAAEMLLALLNGQQVPDRVVLPAEMVVRQSCGCTKSPEVGEQVIEHILARMNTEQQMVILREASEAMVTSFGLDDLLAVVALELPRLGVGACYLSLYENPKEPTGWSRLMLAYDAQGRIALPKSGVRFLSRKLVPEGILTSAKPFGMVVEALYSNENQLGFVLMEIEPAQAGLCSAMRGLLSSALQSVLLFEQRTQAEAKLRQAYDILEQRVEERTAELVSTNAALQAEIIERKRVEGELRESQERLRRISEASFEGIGFSEGGRVIDANPQLAEMFGYRLDELIGKEIMEFIAPESRQIVKDRSRSGEPVAYEHMSIKKDGTRVPVEVRSNNVMYGGRPVRVTVIRDITERKRAEEAIRTLNLELEQRIAQRTAELEIKARELETFAYSVAHDLKAPLRGIDGYSSLLKDDYSDKLDEDGLKFLESIRRATAHMNQLIDDLLAYSRLERRSLTKGQVHLPTLIASLLADQADEIERRGVVVRVDLPQEVVLTDREGLSQALRNLLDNALKFTREITVPQIEIGGLNMPNSCILWVKDNGIGFDMQYHDRIFEIFHRLCPMDDYPGTGVGLALVRKVMDRLGGRTWAESFPGFGAIFYLEFPNA